MNVLEPSPARTPVSVVGGGPAGLRAAEIMARAGLAVTVFEGKPSVGRKFLVAGRGGLNLTHSEKLEAFAGRYTDGDRPGRDATSRWASLLASFSPGDLREWAAGLGVETYVGTSGRVFPRGQQAATLLRRWVERLRQLQVTFQVNHRWIGLEAARDGRWRLRFEARMAGEVSGLPVVAETEAVVFALGGVSWPQTGSDGGWTSVLGGQLGMRLAPWQPANCGWEVPWSSGFLEVAEGLPLKNIALRVGDQWRTVCGEALVTRYGLEGGALYALGPDLRRANEPRWLWLDLKPTLSAAQLSAKLPTAPRLIAGKVNPPLELDEICRPWRLGPAARALLEFYGPGRRAARESWTTAVKALPVPILGPRPMAEAISTAGGLAWDEIREDTLDFAASRGFSSPGK